MKISYFFKNQKKDSGFIENLIEGRNRKMNKSNSIHKKILLTFISRIHLLKPKTIVW